MASNGEKLDKQLTGLCGEHYVSALLAGHGLVVALPRGGASRSDLFVADNNRGSPLRVQVKTAHEPYGPYKGEQICSWATSDNIVDTHDENLWFAFVALRGWPGKQVLPEVFFLPSKDVATVMSTEKGRSRTFFWMRLSDAREKYGDAIGVASLKEEIAKSCEARA